MIKERENIDIDIKLKKEEQKTKQANKKEIHITSKIIK
jgi:hypothetical protein